MIGAVVLAAGESRRMGQPKMLLPWGRTTVIGQVVTTLLTGSVDEVVVVAGALRNDIADALQGLAARNLPTRVVFNPNFSDGEMVRSLQVGLENLNMACAATLVVLGDQPQMELGTVAAVLDAYRQGGHSLIVPSFEHRRGHPWLVQRSLWPEVFRLRKPQTLRDFLNTCADQIFYLSLATSTIFADLDTPEDYARMHPGRKFQSDEDRGK